MPAPASPPATPTSTGQAADVRAVAELLGAPMRTDLIADAYLTVEGVEPVHIRAAADDGSAVLFGHFAVFNRWTEIDSFWEGHFMERIAPGAFKKTMREGRDRMRVLLNHGRDPELGDRPLGPITELREDDVGGYYEVRLFDGVPVLVQQGLRAGVYGASFRFSVVREEFVKEVEPSEENPRGLPERTLTELRVSEFGPVTFPAYAEATAKLRSLDPFPEMLAARFAEQPGQVRDLLAVLERGAVAAPAEAEEEQEPVVPERTAEEEQEQEAPPQRQGTGQEQQNRGGAGRQPTPSAEPLYTGKKEKPQWLL